jgi:hypothetical protein
VYTHFFLVLNKACYKFSDTWTHVEFGNLWTSYRKVDLDGLGASDLISKLRASNFWLALKANAVGPNPVNSLVWTNQMVAEVTAAKNAFGHQASDGICNDGNAGLCVCKHLIARVFEHARGTNTEGLLRLVAANMPCGVSFNFKDHAATLAGAIGSLYRTHPHVLSPLESIAALIRKQASPSKPAKKPPKSIKTEEEPAPKKRRQEAPSNDQFFYSASIRFMQSRYSHDGVKHTQAGVTIGGVDPNHLIAAMNSIFNAA